jgi:UDP-N-acetyl-2-amino-2-deoxyglucuronate dehydrogenase
MTNTITFAILGAGHIGKRHAEMIARNEECTLTAIIDSNSQTLEAALKLYPVKGFGSLEEYLDSGLRSDVICIATPNGLHAEQALRAIETGHHVVIEKPMGLTKKACEDVIYKALHHSKHVFCVMQNRYSPPSEWLKQVVTQKLLGDIYMVQVNCYWNRDDRYYKPGTWHGSATLDGGTLFTQFSHFIDLMYWVFGDIEQVQAKFADHNHSNLTGFEDSGFVNFKFINGGMGSLNYSTSCWDKNLESSMTIIGENGSIKVGGQYMDKVEYCHIKDYMMPELKATNPPNDYGQYKGSAANHHYVIANVVDVLKGRSSITTNALEGLKVVDIIERIYAIKQSPKG